MDVIYATLSHTNSSSKIGQDYCFADTYVNLTQPLSLEKKGISLVDIEGFATPRQKTLVPGGGAAAVALDIDHDKTFYLCCDFVEPSTLHLDNSDTVAKFPILRRISLDKPCTVVAPINRGGVVQHQSRAASCVKETYAKLLFLPSSRNVVETFRLYLIDGQGNPISFEKFDLKCTLLATNFGRHG